VQEREQRFGEPGEVPLGDDRLVAVRVASGLVDGAEDRSRVVGLHEGARAVVDGLARDRHVVGVHDPVDEADEHPLRDQRRLRGDDGVEELHSGGRVAVMPGDRVIGQPPQEVDVSGGSGVLEAADPQMAAGDPGEHGAGQQGLAPDRAAGRHDGERARRGDAEGVHGLADDVLAQHRTDSGQAVTAARERRPPRALEVQVPDPPGAVGDLPEQQGAAVTKSRHEATELVTGVRLRDGAGAGSKGVSHEQAQPFGGAQLSRVQAQLPRQRFVERQQPWRRGWFGPPRDSKLRQLAGEAGLQPKPDAHVESSCAVRLIAAKVAGMPSCAAAVRIAIWLSASSPNRSRNIAMPSGRNSQDSVSSVPAGAGRIV